MKKVIISFFVLFFALPPIVAPFIGAYFFWVLGKYILVVLLIIFGILYFLNILDARRDVPRHSVDLINFAKYGTPIKVKRWMFYYNFDSVIKKIRESDILTPLKLSDRIIEIYLDIQKLARELESSFEDIKVSLEQISSSVSQISRAFSDVVSSNMSKIYSSWIENKVRVEEGLGFLENNIVLFEDMGLRFSNLVKSLEGSEGSVKRLINSSKELRDFGKFISILSYQVSLESVKYRSPNILKMVDEMRALAENTRNITLRSLENLEELDNFLVENLNKLQQIGFDEVVRGAREIGYRFSEIEDSVNMIAQNAGIVSRTIEEASSSLTEISLAAEEINVALKDLMGDVNTIRKTADDLNYVIENLKRMFSISKAEYRRDSWVIWLYGAFLILFSILLILGGYILWKEGLKVPSFILYFGGVQNLIAVVLLRLTAERYILSVLQDKGGFEVVSAYVPLEATKEYIRREFYEKPKKEIEILILGLNSLMDKLRETFVSIKEIGSQISQISTAVKQMSRSFEDILKPSMDELAKFSENALRSSKNGYQITLGNTKDFENKMEILGRIILDLERVSDMAKQLSENVESLSKAIQKINIISINATVEAYKIGEGGPFEVVSREIRVLSEKSNLIIDDIVKGMNEVKNRIDEIMKERDWWEGNMEGVRSRARSIVDVFGDVSERIERNDEMLREIVQALYESASAVKETYVSLDNIDKAIIKMSETFQKIREKTSEILDEVKELYAKA